MDQQSKNYMNKQWVYVKNYFEDQLSKVKRTNYSQLDFDYKKSLLDLSKDLLGAGLVSCAGDLCFLKRIVVELIDQIFSNPEALEGRVEKYASSYSKCKLMLIEIYRQIMEYEAEAFFC